MKFKEQFFGYYPPTEADLESWWKTALFVFDANAILGFYSLEERTRTELFEFLESVKSRVWVPHQAGFEFHKNRVEAIEFQVNKYKKAIGKLKNLVPDMRVRAGEAQKDLDAPEAVKAVALQVASNFDRLFSQINEGTSEISESIGQLLKELEAVREKQQELVSNDPILTRLTELIGDNIGEKYDEKRLKEIHADGAVRYASQPKVPPGYADESKLGNSKYGDLLVWFQTIDKAKSAGVPILMVNNEQKPDWTESVDGSRKIRKELTQEMYKKATEPFYMYTLPQFMEAAKRYSGASFSADALSDANRVESEEVARLNFNETESKQTRSSLYGDFIIDWLMIESHLAKLLAESGNDNRNINSSQALDTLRAQGEISDKHHNRLHWLRQFKNALMHGTGFFESEADIQVKLEELREIIDELGIKAQIAITAVSRTLQAMYPTANLTLQRDKPNIFLTRGLEVAAIGVETVTTMDLRAFNKVMASLTLGDGLVAQGNVDSFVHVAVCGDKAVALSSAHILSSTGGVSASKVWVGYLEEGNFVPTTNIPFLHPLFTQSLPE